MPVPVEIAHAASTFRQNDSILAKSFAGLTQEEWLRQPSEQRDRTPYGWQCAPLF